MLNGVIEKIILEDIGHLEQLGPEEEKRFWESVQEGAGAARWAAAKSHLAAGRPIYYCDDAYPGAMVKKWPDGRRELVNVDAAGVDAVLCQLD